MWLSWEDPRAPSLRLSGITRGERRAGPASTGVCPAPPGLGGRRHLPPCGCGSRGLRAFRSAWRGHADVRGPGCHPARSRTASASVTRRKWGRRDRDKCARSCVTSAARHAAPRPREQTTRPQDGCACAGRSPKIHRALHQAPVLYPPDRNLIQAGFWK